MVAAPVWARPLDADTKARRHGRGMESPRRASRVDRPPSRSSSRRRVSPTRASLTRRRVSLDVVVDETSSHFLVRSISGKTYAPVNLDRIAHWIEQGRLSSSPEKPITARELVTSGCIHNARDGVKLLSDVRHHLPAFCLHFLTRFLMRCWESPGFRTSRSSNTHYAFSRVQVCHPRRRETGRHGSM